MTTDVHILSTLLTAGENEFNYNGWQWLVAIKKCGFTEESLIFGRVFQITKVHWSKEFFLNEFFNLIFEQLVHCTLTTSYCICDRVKQLTQPQITVESVSKTADEHVIGHKFFFTFSLMACIFAIF